MTRTGVLGSLYATKAEGYFTNARWDLLQLVEGKRLSVLEVGAGSGATLRAAKESGLAARAVAIDIVEPVRRESHIDEFHVGSVEDMAFSFAAHSFDVILLGDVLEHLIDPWKAVLRLRELLSEDGVMLSSLPNARNFRLLRDIVLRGDFRYGEAGLNDIGHLRFFCRRNAIELFERAGLDVTRVAENMGAYGWAHRLMDRLTLKLFHEFFVFQYLLVARRRE
jgi:SAM-dependent methyltransferase